MGCGMSAGDIVRDLIARRFELLVDGERLTICPAPPFDLRGEITRQKSAIIAFLREHRPCDAHAFAALASADRESVRALGVCIGCGIPWEMHGKPAFEAWRFVDDANEVALIEARAIVAAAAAEGAR